MKFRLLFPAAAAALLALAAVLTAIDSQAHDEDESRGSWRTDAPHRRQVPVVPLRWQDRHVRLEVLPGQTLLPQDVAVTLHLRFEVMVPEPGKVERQPLNVALVLDRSGSMEGDKIDCTRRTAELLLDRFRAHDRLALVSYATDVRIDARSHTDLDRSSLRRKIRALRADGSTNLYGGLEAGVQQVARHLRGGVNRVFLLSDGLANVGLLEPESMVRQLASELERGVSITTIGVGLDFNERLMALLASEGRGRHYFVEDPEALAGTLTDELLSAGATVVQSAELELELAAGVELERVYGHRVTRQTGRVRIALRDLAAGEHLKALVALRIAPEATSEAPIARLSFTYRGADDRDHRLDAPRRLELPRSADGAAVESSAIEAVEAEIAYTSTGDAFSEASDLLRSGHRDAAQDLLRRTRDATREACSRYGVQKVCQQAEHLDQRLGEMERIGSAADESRIHKSAILDVDAPYSN